MNFIEVGLTYINMDLVTHIELGESGLTVYFAISNGNGQVVKKFTNTEEANAILDYVAANSNVSFIVDPHH